MGLGYLAFCLIDLPQNRLAKFNVAIKLPVIAVIFIRFFILPNGSGTMMCTVISRIADAFHKGAGQKLQALTSCKECTSLYA